MNVQLFTQYISKSLKTRPHIVESIFDKSKLEELKKSFLSLKNVHAVEIC